jgi:hypothetical protein
MKRGELLHNESEFFVAETQLTTRTYIPEDVTFKMAATRSSDRE